MTTVLTFCKRVLLLSVAALLVGCNILSPVKTTPTNYYMLTDINLQSIQATPTNLSLLVTSNSDAVGFDNTGMAYMERPYQLQYFAESYWLQPPAKMLVPLAVASLQKTNRFKVVEAPPYVGNTDLRLKVTLLYLYEDFITKPVMQRMGVRATLLDSRNNQVLGVHVFNLAEPVPSADPYGGVKAANAATAKMLGQLSAFVVQVSDKAL